MTQLELKHLAPYLPYGLQYKGQYGGVSTLRKLEYCRPYNKETDSYSDEIGVDGYLIQYIKPLLRPMSDLTKEIEINGIRFEPSYWFEIGDDENDSLEFDFGNIKLIKQIEGIAQNECHHDLQFLPYFVINKFFEWHFDVFSLIPAGLAIDINELNKTES